MLLWETTRNNQSIAVWKWIFKRVKVHNLCASRLQQLCMLRIRKCKRRATRHSNHWITRHTLHHGGGVGMGYSQHSGVVIVADGTPEAAARLERVLWNDPATGVMRHADAGYEIARTAAREHGLNLPSLK